MPSWTISKFTTGATYRIEPTGTGYFAEIPDLPGCITEGLTLDEAFTNIQAALRLYVEGSIAEGLPVPERYRALVAVN